MAAIAYRETLARMRDVNLSSPADGESLVYDLASGKWINAVVSGGPGGGDMLAANNLSELTNVATARTNLGAASAAQGALADTALQTETDPIVGAITGLVKSDGFGTITAAVANTDYLTPTGNGSGLTLGVNGSFGSDLDVLWAGLHNGTETIWVASIQGNGALLTALNATELTTGTLPIDRISDGAVTFAKLQDIATARLLGRSTAGSGDVEELTIGSGLTLAGGELSASGGGDALTSNPLSQFAATTSAQLRTVLSDELGTGAALFDGATPTGLTLTNATGLPQSGVTNLTSDLALKAPLASPTFTGTVTLPASTSLVTPILGTPTSGTLTNATGLPISTGVSGLGTGVATFLATPSSANLLSAVTDETGSGLLVFGTSPVLTTPRIAAIHDANGVIALGIATVASQVSSVLITPTITGSTAVGPKISPVSSDTNTAIYLESKGTGRAVLQIGAATASVICLNNQVTITGSSGGLVVTTGVVQVTGTLSVSAGIADATNLALGTTTGTKIGTGTTQKLGFWNTTPVIQPAAALQAAVTNSTGGTQDGTLVDVTTAAVADPAKINDNFTDLFALQNAMRTALVNAGLMKGAA